MAIPPGQICAWSAAAAGLLQLRPFVFTGTGPGEYLGGGGGVAEANDPLPGPVAFAYAAGGAASDWAGLTSTDPVRGAFCVNPWAAAYPYNANPLVGVPPPVFLLHARVLFPPSAAPALRFTLALRADGTDTRTATFAADPVKVAARAWQAVGMGPVGIADGTGDDQYWRLAIEFQRGDTNANTFYLETSFFTV